MWNEQRIVETKAKCPKCGNRDLTITELWKNHSVTWEQEDGKIDRTNGILEPGDAYKVIGECKPCDHIWTFRKALQIDDIVKDS